MSKTQTINETAAQIAQGGDPWAFIGHMPACTRKLAAQGNRAGAQYGRDLRRAVYYQLTKGKA